MSRLDQDLADAIRRSDGLKALRVAERLRFNLRLNYEQSFEYVRARHPEVTRSQWDDLLYEGEDAVTDDD